MTKFCEKLSNEFHEKSTKLESQVHEIQEAFCNRSSKMEMAVAITCQEYLKKTDHAFASLVAQQKESQATMYANMELLQKTVMENAERQAEAHRSEMERVRKEIRELLLSSQLHSGQPTPIAHPASSS